MTRLTMTTALTLAALAAPAWAQAPTGHDHSHSSDTAKSAPADPAPGSSPTAAPQGGMGHMGMMSDMKNMMGRMSAMHDMGMMHMMGMMGRGSGGMATIDRIEGRIAFLRAELKITDAQADSWNGFADALRANARKLAEIRASMMPKPGDAPPAPTLAARLEQQEQWLAARLDGTRAMKSAYIKLNELLSDDQKKTANELLAPHLGIGAMAMMTTAAPLEQKEQGRMPGMGGMGMGMGMGMGKK
ncbi:Spy/CpxP family protein refolding chaperone [Bradyrhizobium roseum]|uniref:Spy/CpxP family protein refolding chaperone n=1 Tax=Bradyrhizobium roseum TaxID=3056648 RepID=UPI002611A58F|nr:Spy/CpxP family protein refolding chaperone [Bradyrhizobium roseus]WKA28763.1 Spy/CpxP family protein refolding chaperone [Bradyrhizobium roseus]